MRICSICGFPKKFARFFDWRSDGTIVSTDRSKTSSKITFLEVDEIDGIFNDLSDTIGIPVDRFLIQAQKGLGKALYASLPVRHVQKIPNNRFLRPQFLARMMVRLIAPDIAGLGDGRLSLDRYRAGEVLVLRFKNSCVKPLLVGGAAGMYESIEEMPGSRATYAVEENGDLVVTLEHSETAEKEERLYLEEIPPGEGKVTYRRCSDCGVPLLASSSFEWRLKEGVIINRLTGRREVVIAVQSVNAILRELERELGEEIPSILRDHQKRYTAKRLRDADTSDADAFWEERFMEMAVRGLGYPRDFTRTGSSIKVHINDAYNQDLYAAKLAGAFEVLNGTTSAIHWQIRKRDNALYEISAA